MALYDVIPSADLTNATVAAAVARFRQMAPKPEAFPSGDAMDQVIALALEQHSDELQEALGDHATLPILQWDASCDGAVRALAARTVFNNRGRNRQAGADVEIDNVATRADAFLERCRPGDPNGKRANPRYIDSGGNKPLDAPFFTSGQGGPGGARRADAFILARAGGCKPSCR